MTRLLLSQPKSASSRSGNSVFILFFFFFTNRPFVWIRQNRLYCYSQPQSFGFKALTLFLWVLLDR